MTASPNTSEPTRLPLHGHPLRLLASACDYTVDNLCRLIAGAKPRPLNDYQPQWAPAAPHPRDAEKAFCDTAAAILEVFQVYDIRKAHPKHLPPYSTWTRADLVVDHPQARAAMPQASFEERLSRLQARRPDIHVNRLNPDTVFLHLPTAETNPDTLPDATAYVSYLRDVTA